jgi:hypothetical protein
MGARTSFSIDVLEASQTSSAVPTGRAIVVGTAGEGPGNTPTLIRGMAEYRAVFGQRAGGADMHDALQQAFACGLAEAWVVRGVGSSAASASGVIDDLTVTGNRGPDGATCIKPPTHHGRHGGIDVWCIDRLWRGPKP